MSRQTRFRAAAVAAVALFVVTRVLVHFGLAPFFDGDTYKHLGGADALWAGQQLPPLYRDLATTGGALHGVPGYAYFMDAAWNVAGRASLRSVLLAQALLSLGGMLALADLVRRWIGPWTALALFVVLTAAPTFAWLEHLLLPDVLAIPLFWMAAWLLVVQPWASMRGGVPAIAVGALCGLVLAAEVMLRTSSQFFLPIALAIAIAARANWRSAGLWMAGIAAGLLVGLLPWMMHNHEIHGVWRVSASTGRNLYFSQLWANALDRARLADQYGIADGASVRSTFSISEETLQRHLSRGMSLVEADEAMGREAMASYRSRALGEIAAERGAVIWGLFVASSSGPAEWMKPLRSNVDDVLANKFYADGWRAWAGKQLQYELLPSTVQAQQDAAGSSPGAETFFRWWVRLLTIDGAPLLALYLAATPLLWLLPSARASAFLVLAAPPLAYLAVFALVGAPLYRYQAALHPFMLATIVVGLAAAWQRVSRTSGRGSFRAGLI